jgi:hypothetical protein
MLKKTLFAFAAIAFLAVAAQAHPEWPSSTWVEWVPKNGPTVPVTMKIVMWADITFQDPCDTEIKLVQQLDGSFEDCVDLKVCVNFDGLLVKAKFTETIPDTKKSILAKDGKWWVSLGPCDTSRLYEEDETEYTVQGVHLTDQEACLRLCVKATGVDPQAREYSAGQWIPVGQVELTMVPTINPF